MAKNMMARKNKVMGRKGAKVGAKLAKTLSAIKTGFSKRSAT